MFNEQILRTGLCYRSVITGAPVANDSFLQSADILQKIYNFRRFCGIVYATATRMAQEAHEVAVRDSHRLHDDACRMAQESHDTAMFDHQAAVALHDHVVSDPGFGCCGPFF